ncbi:sterol desaturase family protein [Fulvivirgaceae bacterium PWU4]|uniref:Sterol desaturase family protein n=1 Tax=Chryseosolibacter histidini TaxID=2782349 RepID=A0AAP2DTN0_9BACT|nr:sterol desaturase family protein [Chryseosolibacter histidini]MBT1701314.1 sterol desaturase family protein [Chryseosolibacter histidini]
MDHVTGLRNERNVPKNKGSRQLFKNPILERLSRTHIAVPLTIFFTYSAVLLYWSITHTSLPVWLTAAMFMLGALVFTWVEYITHRYVFHMGTYTKLREKIQYTVHGVHHEFPKDKERLAMPPLLSITIATLLLLLFRLIMGDLAFSFLPGFLSGYALYLSVHYMVHVYQPPKNFLKVLWINHSVHHYKHGEYVFGVSSPLWDYIYGTMKEKKKHTAAA